ncbi:helix-turn-helix transcriptional regulator [Rhizobium sp.]|uniref:helix-turn-helix domain-containing protein n=1 Tax=Rhizobium sp. TaxID=391 RepID=UPI0028AFC506
MPTFGPWVKNARLRLGMTQAEFAARLDRAAQSTVSKWERNLEQPRAASIVKINALLISDAYGEPRDVQPHEEAPLVEEAREGGPHDAISRASDLREYIEEVIDLLHALDKIGDGIGGADGYSVSAVALAAKSVADNALDTVKAMEHAQ